MMILRKFLLPLSLGYGAIVRARNLLYDKGVLSSATYPFPVICVGNLSMGGTGKTPMIEYLLRLLVNEHRTATLSRGYGRKTSGFYLLKGNEKAHITGDEPLQFKLKFPQATVAVDEDRQRGIANLLSLTSPEVILLDDAFQHRRVHAGLYILLTTYGDLYKDDHILPAGNLREPVAGAARAKIIVVTKCPVNLRVEERAQIEKKLQPKRGQKIFFSYIAYGKKLIREGESMELDNFKGRMITLVTGIANPVPLVQFLKDQGILFEHLKFPDHHNFSEKELKEIGGKELVFTTEKDYMRLKDGINHPAMYYLPIEQRFIEGGLQFDLLVKQFILEFTP